MTSSSVTGLEPARQQAAAAADDQFGVSLYRRLGASQQPEAGQQPEASQQPGAGQQNLVFSPASIAAALQLALAGARGRTAAQLAGALRLGPADPATAAQDGLRLLSAAVGPGQDAAPAAAAPAPAARDRALILRAPSSLWVQSGLPLEASFTRPLQDLAAAMVREADFRGAPQQARSAINDLIAEQTAGKITNLLGRDAVTASTRLVLANAVYLKAPWAFPFTAGATRDAPFHPGPSHPGPSQASPSGPASPSQASPSGPASNTSPAGNTGSITVPMMHRTADLPYRRGDGYQAVLLPYQNSSLAMAIVLPDGPLAGLAARLDDGRGLNPLLAGAERQSVALALPKFRQRTSISLIPALRDLGVQDAFTDQADFSGITTAAQLLISAVVHQAYIDVDEQGTEAAAATAVTMRPMALRRGPEPIPLTVDRPFLFAILDTATGLPLFLGQVTRPQTSPAGTKTG
jgi:serpin B